jgi:hypothetical protein
MLGDGADGKRTSPAQPVAQPDPLSVFRFLTVPLCCPSVPSSGTARESLKYLSFLLKYLSFLLKYLSFLLLLSIFIEVSHDSRVQVWDSGTLFGVIDETRINGQTGSRVDARRIEAQGRSVSGNGRCQDSEEVRKPVHVHQR